MLAVLFPSGQTFFAFSDDHASHAVSAYGSEIIDKPNPYSQTSDIVHGLTF
jgi:hypothetical protein